MLLLHETSTQLNSNAENNFMFCVRGTSYSNSHLKNMAAIYLNCLLSANNSLTQETLRAINGQILKGTSQRRFISSL